MRFAIFLKVALAFVEAGAIPEKSSGQWETLNDCIHKLKTFEQKVSQSLILKTVVPFDRKLKFMVEGVRYAELNSEQLKNFVGSVRSDKQAHYLLSNARVACEADVLKMSNYFHSFKRFFALLFITIVALSFYVGYLLRSSFDNRH